MNKNDLLEKIRSAKRENDFFECCVDAHNLLAELKSEERSDVFAWFLHAMEEYYLYKKDIEPLSEDILPRFNCYSLKYRKLVQGLIDVLSPNGYTKTIYYQKLWNSLDALLLEATEEEKGFCLLTVVLDLRSPYYELPHGLKFLDKKHQEIFETIKPIVKKFNFMFNVLGFSKLEAVSLMVHLLEELDSIEKKTVFLDYLLFCHKQRAVENSKNADVSTLENENPVELQ